jgi:integrase
VSSALLGELQHNSLVVLKRVQNIVKNRRGGRLAPTTVNSSVRTREYLTTAEIERLMAAARKSSRYGHRDATMILIGYRHGLRASELCDLQWSQAELTTGRLHVRRAKNSRGLRAASAPCVWDLSEHCQYRGKISKSGRG